MFTVVERATPRIQSQSLLRLRLTATVPSLYIVAPWLSTEDRRSSLCTLGGKSKLGIQLSINSTLPTFLFLLRHYLHNGQPPPSFHLSLPPTSPCSFPPSTAPFVYVRHASSHFSIRPILSAQQPQTDRYLEHRFPSYPRLFFTLPLLDIDIDRWWFGPPAALTFPATTKRPRQSAIISPCP